jgi:hypothetical protein
VVVRTRIVVALAIVPFAWIPVAGCELIFPSRVAQGPADGSSGMDVDASLADASSGHDVEDAGDASPRRDAACEGPFVYHDMTSAEYWSTFDLSTINASAIGYFGGAFDGRFVYFAPTPYSFSTAGNGTVARYDTMGPFMSDMSWSTFDTAELGVSSSDFAGAVFDGRYVLLVGAGGNTITGASVNTTVRYDTQSSFTSLPSWTFFNLLTLGDAGASRYVGGVFDGLDEYFAPGLFGETSLRFDTKNNFTDPSSWESFNTEGVVEFESSFDYGFSGAVFDGQYVYFVPNNDDGMVGRFDTQASFTALSSWTNYPIPFPPEAGSASYSGGIPGSTSYSGGAYDGRFVYFVPETTGLAVRYDTHATFATAGSWSVFDMFSVSGAIVPEMDASGLTASTFTGGAFDGRFVYFVPASPLCPCARITRFDSQGDFTDPAAWSTFDTTTLGANVFGFAGAVFDGRYVYLVPFDNAGGDMADGIVARFDAKTPPCLPDLPGFTGSFL